MEKSLNKLDLKAFKGNEIAPAAMVPGLNSESPLRNLGASPSLIRKAIL